jgi:hypothetical protein
LRLDSPLVWSSSPTPTISLRSEWPERSLVPMARDFFFASLRVPNVGYGWLLAIFFSGSSVIRALSDTGTLIVLITSVDVGFVFGRVALSDLTTVSQSNQRFALAVAFVALSTFAAVRRLK